MVRKFDFLVIGSGIAGMSFALKVLSPTVVAKVRNHRKSLSCHNKQGDSLFY